ncbi:PAS domain S-box protein [Acidovorax sp. CF316]|uniref:PAS domain S-box protein n=1 Tax=Acidovorax sp. CF316 TaxID=1144317 RepID=UPI0002F11630|nr:PAS domain S-box protein [Acidovorax sp. CF316]
MEYAVHALELEAAVCYCETCRRASGGAGMVWVGGDRGTLRVYGALHTWRSSDHGARQLCPECGSQLFRLEDAQPGVVEVAVGTLDDASAIRSTHSAFANQRPRWDARMALGSQPLAPVPGLLAKGTLHSEAPDGPARDETLHSMLTSTQDAFVSIDPGGFITEWNPQAQAALGWSYDEAIGRPMHELIIPPEMRSAHLYGMARLQRTGEGPVLRRRFEVDALHKDGHRLAVELSIAPLRMAGGIGATAFIRDTSQRQAVERELRANQDLLQRTGELALVGSWTVDLPASTVHWSPMVRRIHGVDDDFVPTLPGVVGFYEEGAQERLIAAFEQGIEDGQKWEIEAPLRTPDGRRVWARAIGNTEYDEHGAPVRVVGALQDITGRKRAEESLHMLTQILEATPDYVVQADKDGRVTYMNPAARQAQGYDAGYDVTQHRFIDFNTPETTRRYRDEVMPAVHKTGVWMGESTVLVAGQPIAVDHSVLSHKDATGQVVRYTAVMRDISAQQRARADLFRQQRTLSSIAEAIPDVIAVVDREGRYEFVNSAFEKLVGPSRAEIVGHKIGEVMPIQELQGSMAHIQKAQGGEPTSFELDLNLGGRQRNMAITLVPRQSEGGTPDGFIAVLDDVTIHRQRESRLIGLSERDGLTGLVNRQGLEAYLQRIPLGEAHGVAMLYVDLDRFKPVNDTWGHPVGDQLLQAVAARFLALVRPMDLVARVGGDEFVVVLGGMPGRAAAEQVADKLVATAAKPFDLGGRRVLIGASVGVAFAGDDGWRGLMERADASLYRAKAAGRGRRA